MRRVFVPLVFLVCGFLEAQNVSSAADKNPAEKNPMDDLIFKVAVFGPSDEIFIWWGHAALIVADINDRFARIYDWGIFSYEGDSFMKAFAQNGVRYKCGVSPAYWDIQNYIEEDRDIIIYTLDLEATKKEAVLDYADTNVLPENQWYIYHQFKDNCSTRIRDLVDRGTGGQLREYFENSAGRFTLRGHMRRFTRGSLFFDWFLNALLGRDIDRGSTMWEEMYLPVELGRNITDFYFTDDSGAQRKLVTDIEMVNRTQHRKAVLDAPYFLWPYTLALGLAAAAFLALVCLLRRKYPRWGRALWGISHSILGLGFGLMGTVLFFASRPAERDYMRHNINLLFINPLLLLAVPLGVAAAVGGKIALGKKFIISAEQCLRILWLCVCAAALIAALMNLLPFLRQGNGPVLTLILPVTLALILPERKKA